MKNTETKDDYLTEDEIRAALVELKPADLIRLSKIAAVFAGRGLAGEDLLQEAVLRVLDGRRRWKRGMGTCAFLHSTMSSIADAGFKKKSAENATAVSKDQSGEEKVQKLSGSSAPSPEDARIKKEDTEEYAQKNLELSQKIFELFKDDEIATMILMGLEEGLPVEEICEIAGITKTQYDSARRRIRRTVDKTLPNKRS